MKTVKLTVRSSLRREAMLQGIVINGQIVKLSFPVRIKDLRITMQPAQSESIRLVFYESE